MYNLEKAQEEILKEMMKEPLVNNDNALEVYKNKEVFVWH